MTPAQILQDPELQRLQHDLVLATFRADDSGEFSDLGERDAIALAVDARIEMLAKQKKNP